MTSSWPGACSASCTSWTGACGSPTLLIPLPTLRLPQLPASCDGQAPSHVQDGVGDEGEQETFHHAAYPQRHPDVPEFRDQPFHAHLVREMPRTGMQQPGPELVAEEVDGADGEGVVDPHRGQGHRQIDAPVEGSQDRQNRVAGDGGAADEGTQSQSLAGAAPPDVPEGGI